VVLVDCEVGGSLYKFHKLKYKLNYVHENTRNNTNLNYKVN